MIENTLHHILGRVITEGNFRVIYPSGRTEQYGNGAGKPLAIRITDKAALRAIVLDPGLRAPEMYMDGRLVIEEGDIYELIALAKANTNPEVLTPGAWFQHLRRSVTDAPIAHAVGLKTARANVAHHYDLDERLYRLFLDGDMQYSCAYFERPDMTLDQAQLAKKRLIAAKLLVKPGARVIDIGCGWGGMALYLARVCGAEVVGVTLSQEQLRVARARAEAAGLADRVTSASRTTARSTDTFDNIVSVGMFEHVGLRQYPVFFRTAARLLRRDGVMLLHSMAQPTKARYNQPFMEKYIFPGGYIPALSEVTPAVEKSGLVTRDVEILSLHYAETRVGLAPALPRAAREGARALRRALHPHVGVLSRRLGERLPLRPDARRPPPAGPSAGARPADPRLHPRSDGAARRGRACRPTTPRSTTTPSPSPSRSAAAPRSSGAGTAPAGGRLRRRSEFVLSPRARRAPSGR